MFYNFQKFPPTTVNDIDKIPPLRNYVLRALLSINKHMLVPSNIPYSMFNMSYARN